MTDPERGTNPHNGAPPPPSWEYPPPSPGFPPPPGDFPPPGAYSPPGFPPPNWEYPPPPGGYYDPAAPYGRDQLTGQPLSDKSKVIAGLLQLIGVFGLVGFGRIYLGHTRYGVIQLVVGIVTCGIGALIWGIVDAVMIFSGSVADKDGRPLRDGA
jgi:TM2 domain-containing membrane protein YozV